MSYFRANAVIVKMVNDVEIVFWSKEEIYVKDCKSGTWTLFHRYFAPKGSYNGGWRQFRHLLLYEWRNLDYNHCFRLAFRWDIQSKVVKSGPDLATKIVKERKNDRKSNTRGVS